MKGAGSIAPFPFRCDPVIKEKVQELAKKNRRSLNSELNFLIETALNELAPAAPTAEAGVTANTTSMETCDAKYSD